MRQRQEEPALQSHAGFFKATPRLTIHIRRYARLWRADSQATECVIAG